MGSGVEDLRLHGKRISADVSRAVTGKTPLKRTISGASSIVVQLADPNMKMLRKPFARQATTLVVDGLNFRMVGVKHKDGSTTLTFEDAAVARLRARKGPKKASRGKVTRAQFIGQLAREAGVPFVSPERRIVQPIEKRSKAKRTVQRNERREHGFDRGARIKVKNVSADAEQRRIAEIILDEGMKLARRIPGDLVFRVLSMAIACATQENNMRSRNPGDAAGPDSRGPFGQRLQYYPNAADPHAAARYFYLGRPEVGIKGIIETVKANPTKNFSLTINDVQRSAHPTLYQQWKAEANNTVREYLGGEGSGSTTVTTEVEKPYSFEVKRGENYWQAIQRLAKEVNWRAFVTAGKLFYFTDQRLLRSRPRMRVSSDHAGLGTQNYPPGIDAVEFELHMGKRVESATIKGRAARWAAPPGSAVIFAEDFGAASGRWLVSSITTNLGDRDASIKLTRLRRPLPEPAPETTTRSVTVPGRRRGSSGGSGIDSVNIVNTSPGSPHWGGSYAVFKQFINPFMQRQGLSTGSTKRSYNTGSSVSDHYVGSTLAYAVDYPTGSGESAARALAKALGASYSPGQWNSSTITVDGHRFSCQILWAAPDGTHYDHVHVGLRRQ